MSLNKLTAEMRKYLANYAAAHRSNGVSQDDVVRKMVEQEAEERFDRYVRPADAARLVEISRMAPEARAAALAAWEAEE
jgi:hypothetical protein